MDAFLPRDFSGWAVTSEQVLSTVAPLVPTSLQTNWDVVWQGFLSTAQAVGTAVAPFARSSLVLRIPAFEAAVDGLAADVGQEPKTVRYLLCLLLAYPLALVMANLRNPTLKHLFSALTGMFVAQFVFGEDWAHSLISSSVAYAILALTSPFSAFNGFRHNLVFVWMMAYMTAVHLYRMHVDYLGWTLDYTGPQMLLTIKLTALAYNHYDGVVMRKKYEQQVAAGHPMSKIFAERIKRGISGVPNLLEYFGYVFCFTTFFAGPAFEIGEYLRSTRETSFEISTGGKVTGKDLKWGSRAWSAISNLVLGIGFLGLTVYGQANFPFSAVTSAAMLYGPGASFLHRAGYTFVALFFTRCKYYFAWLVAEGSANLAGFGYQSDTGKWAGARNMEVLSFELAGSVTDASKAWNMQTQSWLARYSNQRLPKGWNIWGTYLLSAVWHGFYPGYYLFFLSAPLLQSLEKELAAKVKPRVKSLGSVASFLYSLGGRVLTPLALNYFICPFVALSWDTGVLAWASFYFVGHAATLVLLVLLSLVPAVKGAGGKASRNGAAAEGKKLE